MDECHRLAKSLKRLTRIRGQTDVRLNSSTRQLASDPRSQTAEPQNNRCDVAASCPHSISAKRLECCTDRLSPPSIADNPRARVDVRCTRRKQTSESRAAMSALGQEQTCSVQQIQLLNHLVGDGEDVWRNREAERLRGVKVDHELEFCRLHDRQISRLFALEYPSNIDAE